MNADVLPETTPPGHEFHYLEIGSVGTGFLVRKPQRLRFGSAPSRARRIARKDDTIVSTVRTYLKAVYFIEEDVELVCSTGFAVLTPQVDTLPKLVSYVAQSNPFMDQVTGDSIGTAYPAIPEARLGSFWIAVPPYAEQIAIVRFLDHMNRRIGQYIRAKQKLIKLLEEQKQAIIQRAVTHGLDPNVRLKRAQLSILGEVPEHWRVARLSHFFTLQRGFDITKDQQRNGLVPVVSSGGVFSYHDRATGIGPGVIVGRKGTAGAVHYVESDYWAHDTTLWVNDFKGNSPRFIYYVLLSLKLQSFDTGSSNPTLYRYLIHPEPIAFPPVREQVRIASWLDKHLMNVTHTAELTRRQISQLAEYRNRLIADVVTGKVDVREAAANLPREPEESEPADEGEQISGERVEDEVEDELVV
jgi:type I restriction enzyme S subunit